MSKTEDSTRRFAQLEGERDYYKRLAERREIELDALKRQIDENIEYLMNAQTMAEEREALAAHVERLNSILFDTFAAIEDGDDSALPYDAYRDAFNESPAVSLERRDALKQVEALSTLLGVTSNGDSGAAIREVIFDRIQKLRRQAEGAGDA